MLEKKIVESTIKKDEPSVDNHLKSSLNFQKTKTDHLAVFITGVLGSMGFLVGCILVFLVWICWNINLLPFLKPFDQFPFPILQMAVSIFAIILSVAVLISQNRQGRMDKISRQVEFEVNVRAESEVTKVLNMLHDIHQKLGLDSKEDKELEQMKEQTDISQIYQTVDDRDIKPD
jgi:uncharacterized membrane protein